jgi:hypothetical protein
MHLKTLARTTPEHCEAMSKKLVSVERSSALVCWEERGVRVYEQSRRVTCCLLGPCAPLPLPVSARHGDVRYSSH